DLFDRFVDARVQAECESVSGGIDGVEYLGQVVAFIAQDVQYGAEHLAFKPRDAVDFNEGGGDEGAELRAGGQGQLQHAHAGVAHLLHVFFDIACGIDVDDRADVGGKPVGVADTQLVHRPTQHGQQAIGAVVLHAQHTQRGAALAGGIKGGSEYVIHHLLGQRGGVHHHGVLTAGFGNEGYRGTVA